MTSLGRPASCSCDECPKCKHRIYMKEWWNAKAIEERRAIIARRDIERVRAADRARGRRKNLDYQDDPVKVSARIAVNNAVRDGRLKKRPCEACGSTTRINAHHPDYSKPLEVVWLCSICHAATHKEARRAA